MLGTSNLRTIAEVLLPASFPSIVAGLRVGAGLGWQSLVGAELIVASAGVGYMMVQGQSNISTPTVMAGMIAIGLVGLADRRRLAAAGGARPPQERARMSAIVFESVLSALRAETANPSPRSTASISPWPTRSSSPWSGRQDAARPPACGWRPGSRCRPSGRVTVGGAAGERARPRPRRRLPAVRALPVEERGGQHRLRSAQSGRVGVQPGGSGSPASSS